MLPSGFVLHRGEKGFLTMYLIVKFKPGKMHGLFC